VDWLFSTTPVDFVGDAIDTLAPKLALLTHCLSHNQPVISSMGSGGRRDPSLIRVADISQTSQCPLAKVVRQGLRARGWEKGLPVVFSTESVDRQSIIPVNERNKRSTIGTVSYLPVLFGCQMAAFVINQ
jgi:tRNA A37 threonylcarbamoyladenosine dehydratase